MTTNIWKGNRENYSAEELDRLDQATNKLSLKQIRLRGYLAGIAAASDHEMTFEKWHKAKYGY